MWKSRKIVVVTPAGRRRYMDLLRKGIDKYRAVVDEWHVWKNTTDPDDVAYINSLASDGGSDFVRVIECPVRVNGNKSINAFLKLCDDPGVVYVRFDDDIVLLDSLDAFQRFLDFRIDNPGYPVVYANILNNAISTWIQQRFGNLPGSTGYDCLDPVAWKDPEFAKRVHDAILAQSPCNSLERFRFDGIWKFIDFERVSVNCVSWIGGTLDVPDEDDEEVYLSCTLPERKGAPNCMFGGYCVVHFAFFTQRDALERHGYLDKYRRRS